MSTSDTQEVPPEITPLDAVIRDYLLRIDRGEVISHQELLASHPELQVDLQAFFDGVAIVQKMAGVPSALTDTSPPTKVDTKYATVAKPDEDSSHVISKTSHSKSAADLTGPFPIMLGQYRILKNIGQGAMGSVYVADDIRLGRKVALKVPLAAVAERPDHLDRFTREARASAQLRHHNICPVYEVNEQDGVQYIAMAYIEGQPLFEVLRKNRRFSGKQIAVTIRKIAQALEVAHRAGIVHRDLKPANIMIDKEGEPIVMDFGLARQMHSVDQAQLTKEGVILGTPAYMSPEQVRSELKRIGPASDIYSLGVILYELLCGSHPFRGPLMTVLMNVADNKVSPRKPSEIRSNCDPQLEAICLRMISKRIADRYPSMKEVAAALSNYIKTGKTAPEIPLTESPGKPADPEPISSPVETPAPAVPTPPQKIEPLKAAPAGTKKPPRRRMGVMLGGLFAAILAGVIIITITTQEGKKTVVTVPEGTEIDVPAPPGAKVSIAVSDAPRPGTPGRGVGGEAPTRGTVGGKKSLGWHGWPADAPPPAIAPFNAEQAKKHQEAWAKYLKVPVEYINSIGMKFALIPPGEFMMGSSKEEIDAASKEVDPIRPAGWDRAVLSEAPMHLVTITQPLYVGIHEVRHADYQAAIEPNPTNPNSAKNIRPVESISWLEAATFCLRLGEREQFHSYHFLDAHLQGDGYRLLTEAEWEYACRAGTATIYPNGDTERQLAQCGWFATSSGDQIHEVGKLAPNAFGLFDMLGNVWEFVQDGASTPYGEDYSADASTDPIVVPSYSMQRKIRGGSFKSPAYQCRSATRTTLPIEDRSVYFGFRIAITVNAVRRALKVDGPWPEVTMRPSSVGSTDFPAIRKAAEQILALGGTIVLESGETIPANESLPFFPSQVLKVRMDGEHITDDDLLHLAQLNGLQGLELVRTAITGAGLARQLASWPQLKSLSLNGMAIEDGKLDLSGAPGLREIVLPQGISNEEVKHLTQECPLLKKLTLPRLSGVELQSLASLKHLSELSCSGEVLTHEGVKSLAANPSLNKLVWHSPVNNEIARCVATLSTQLQSLEIVYSKDEPAPLTDDAYRDLAKSLRLFELTIRGKTGSPTPAALLAIAAAMPDLRSLSIICDDADGTLPPADIFAFRQRHPSINLTVRQRVFQGYASWPEGRTGAIAAWDFPPGAPDPAIAPFSAEKASEYQTKWSDFVSEAIEFENSIGMKFRLIPPSEFVRGLDGHTDSHPSLKLERVGSAYYLSSTEVTVGQFKRFVEATGYKTDAERLSNGRSSVGVGDATLTWKTPGYVTREDLPVNLVSMADAEEFCAWLNVHDTTLNSADAKQRSKTQNHDSRPQRVVYRLPTLAEWIAASSAGSEFIGGVAETLEKQQEYAWTESNVEGKATPVQPVATKLMNPYGLYDVRGNVFEWYTNEELYGGGVIGGGYFSGMPRVSFDTRSRGLSFIQPNVGFRVLRQFNETAAGTEFAPLSRPLKVGYRSPLSAQAKVSRPTPLAGLRSWSVEPKRNSGHMEAIAHHPTEDKLVTGAWDGSIRVWSTKGELLKCFVGHAGSITSLRFFDHGKKILSSDAAGEIRVWDSNAGTVLYSHHAATLMPIALSPDEKTIAASVPFVEMRLTDLATGTTRLETAVHSSFLVAWSPDSKHLATTSAEGTICIWQVNPWKKVADVPLNYQYLSYNTTDRNLTWSPDGKTIAFIPPDGKTVSLIDGVTFSLLPGIDRSVHDWGGHSAIWSHNGNYLATADWNKCEVYDFATRKLLYKIPASTAVCWSHDDSKIYLSTGECFEASTGKLLHDLQWRENVSRKTIALSPDGRFTSSVDGTGRTSVWTADAGQLHASWMNEGSQLPSFWAADGTSLISAKDGKLEFLDPASGIAARSISVHPDGIQAAVLSPDGRSVATSGRADNRLCVLGVESGVPLWTADTKGSRADCIAWAPDGRNIVTGHCATAELRIWDLKDGTLLKSYGPETSPKAIPFSKSLHVIAYLDWSVDRPEVLIGHDYVGLRLDLKTEEIDHWGGHYLRGGHVFQNRLAPNRQSRLVSNEWGFSWYQRDQDSSQFLGQFGRDSNWMPDSRRVLVQTQSSLMHGYDLATQRRIGTLVDTAQSNLWFCIGPTGHLRAGFLDQPGDGTDEKALAAAEEHLIYVVQTEDGTQMTYSPREFAEKFGWKNDPRKATLMKLYPE